MVTGSEPFAGIFGHCVDIAHEDHPVVEGGPHQHLRVFPLADFSLLRRQTIKRGQSETQAAQKPPPEPEELLHPAL